MPRVSVAVALDGMKALRTDKKKVDEDKRVRKGYEITIANAKATIESARKEYTGLQDRLTVVRDVSIHNRMVIRMNALALKAKQASEKQKEDEDKENDMSVEPESKFVDELMALGEKADAASEKYVAVASNPTVKTAIDQSTPKLTLGPSKEFADAVADLKKWCDETESEV